MCWCPEIITLFCLTNLKIANQTWDIENGGRICILSLLSSDLQIHEELPLRQSNAAEISVVDVNWILGLNLGFFAVIFSFICFDFLCKTLHMARAPRKDPLREQQVPLSIKRNTKRLQPAGYTVWKLGYVYDVRGRLLSGGKTACCLFHRATVRRSMFRTKHWWRNHVSTVPLQARWIQTVDSKQIQWNILWFKDQFCRELEMFSYKVYFRCFYLWVVLFAGNRVCKNTFREN